MSGLYPTRLFSRSPVTLSACEPSLLTIQCRNGLTENTDVNYCKTGG